MIRRNLKVLIVLGLALGNLSWSGEIFEGRSGRKPSKAEAIRDAENDLGARISRAIQMQMAVKSERIRSAVGTSSVTSFRDTLQAKALVTWSGFNPKVTGIDSSVVSGSKVFEARVQAEFDRTKFVEEKRAKVALLASQWVKISEKPFVSFLDAISKFYADYDQESAESQPLETMKEWKALSTAIDSVFSIQLKSVETQFTPNPSFDPCGRQRVVGVLSAKSDGAKVNSSWLDLEFASQQYKAQADVDGLRISYVGRCSLLDSTRVALRIRGVADPIADRYIQIKANTTKVKLRGQVSEEEKEVLQNLGYSLIETIGLRRDDSNPIFFLSLEPRTTCQVDTRQGMQSCKVKVMVKLSPTSGASALWSQSLETKGFGVTIDEAKTDALQILDSGRSK
jgi:hypothetical protein